jgi:hypothetical protein
MPTLTLTAISVRSLKPISGKQVTYIDKSLKGFGVRVTETGAKLRPLQALRDSRLASLLSSEQLKTFAS